MKVIRSQFDTVIITKHRPWSEDSGA